MVGVSCNPTSSQFRDLVPNYIQQWVGYGCSLHTSNFSWRFPLSFQNFPAVILACGVWFLPESPRWLIERGKEEAGRLVLTRLHLNCNASNQELVEHEISQIHQRVDYEKQHVVRSWRQLFHSRQWRYRILLACGIQAMTKCSGVNVIENYGAGLYNTLGFSTSTSLMIIGVWGTLAQLWNTIFMTFIDKIGRRKLFIPSLLGMGAVMCV